MAGRNIVEKTATDVVTATSGRLHRIVLTAAADAATAVVRRGGASGTVVLSIKAAIGATVPVDVGGALCAAGIHVTLTGTGPTCTVVWD